MPQENLSNSRDIVLSFIEVLNNENFAIARGYVSDNFRFEGVLGTREGADVYFEDMKKMKLKYQIIKIFADNDDVCVIYNILLSGVNTYSAGLYHIADFKIQSLKVVFDPRPVLEASR